LSGTTLEDAGCPRITAKFRARSPKRVRREGTSDARLYRKGPGQEAKLCFVGHVLMENRHGLVVDAELTRASGHAERLAALAMLDRLPTVGPMTLAADHGLRCQRLRDGAARAPRDPAHRPEH
jgi:hypothetical protein